MRIVPVLAAVAVVLSAASVSVHAQGRGNGQAKKTAVSAPKVKGASQNPKATKPTTKADTRMVKAEARAAKSTVKAETRAAKAETKAARKSGTMTSTATPTGTTTVVTPTTPTTHSVKNPKLEARLLALLPPNTTIQEASQGFKNWGQFVAATHVSNNLNIPFAELKARMTGISVGTLPGTTVQTMPMSLGQAIQSFKTTAPTTGTAILTPTMVNNEVKKAEDAANADLRRTRNGS
jgi:hypothetical protein